MRIGLSFFWVRYFVGVNEVLDLMLKADTIISVVAFLLVEVTVEVLVEVVWHRVWKGSGFQRI